MSFTWSSGSQELGVDAYNDILDTVAGRLGDVAAQQLEQTNTVLGSFYMFAQHTRENFS